MRAVLQTGFGKGQGNCLLACVASLLHRRIEDIPDFNLSGCGWFEELYEWCLNEGVGLLHFHPSQVDKCGFYNLHVICTFEVIGITDEEHAVVGRFTRDEMGRPDMKDAKEWHWRLDIVHDPRGEKAVPLGNLTNVIVLVPNQEQRGGTP